MTRSRHGVANRWQRNYNGRTELRLAALKRLADARYLLSTERDQYARGAGYLAGYAVECRLKVIAMELFRCWTLDELGRKWRVSEDAVYTHGLESFAKRLPFWNRLRNDDEIRRHFSSVVVWRPSWRYDGRDWTCQAAHHFIEHVMSLLDWLERNH